MKKRKPLCTHKVLRSRCDLYRARHGIICNGCCLKCKSHDCEAFFDCRRIGEKGAIDMTKIKGENND